MKEYKNLLFSENEGIGILTVNRPKSMNALNSETLREIAEAMAEIAVNPAVQVVLITGAGDKAFVAGADIAEMQQMSAMDGREMGKMAHTAFFNIENAPQPVIAAVNGYALGGGCELSLACDIRLASTKAKFGQPEVTLGLTPGFGGTVRLPRLVGPGVAKRMIYSGEMIDAQEALRIGLVDKVVEPDQLLEACKQLAKTIMSRSPVAVRMAKVAINKGLNMDVQSAAVFEYDIFGLCFSTEDKRAGVAAFLGKTKPEFPGK